jgi:hypothetical protein
MMHSSPYKPSGSTNNAADTRRIFVRRVHQLLQLGYERLTPAAHVNEQEPAITGFLVEAINAVLNDRARIWMRLFSIHDDPPENDGLRKGKKRKRIDLRIDSAHFSPRARYRFEAKRLGKRHRVAAYLGVEGLGCFLTGDYARDDDEAGMLGYVQSGDLGEWGERIGDELGKKSADYFVDESFPFFSHPITPTESSRSYSSQHHRLSVGRTIRIVHTLMMFH